VSLVYPSPHCVQMLLGRGGASRVNVTDNVVTAEVDHFSRFAVLGVKRQWVYLPIVLRDD
jgi:hypothetical protein